MTTRSPAATVSETPASAGMCLKGIHIGAAVDKQLKSDWDAEAGAIKSYNDGITLAVELQDNGTRELFESILKEEEAHIDWIEAQQDQIKQIGLQMYLAEQFREKD